MVRELDRGRSPVLSSPCRTPPTGPSPESATVGQSVLTRAPDGTDDVGSWACTVACTPSAATAGSTSMTYVSRSAGSAAACGLGPRGASCGASSANIRAIRAPPGGLRIVTFPCGAGNSTWSRPRDSNPGPTHYETASRPGEGVVLTGSKHVQALGGPTGPVWNGVDGANAGASQAANYRSRGARSSFSRTEDRVGARSLGQAC